MIFKLLLHQFDFPRQFLPAIQFFNHSPLFLDGLDSHNSCQIISRLADPESVHSPQHDNRTGFPMATTITMDAPSNSPLRFMSAIQRQLRWSKRERPDESSGSFSRRSISQASGRSGSASCSAATVISKTHRNRFNDPVLRHLPIPRKTADPYPVGTMACQTVVDETSGPVNAAVSRG